MAFDDPETPLIAATTIPQVRLAGSVDDAMLANFHGQLAALEPGTDPIVVELQTLGGDAEIGRRLALEVGLAERRLGPRRLLFLGKTTVFSAGVTMMAGFPREDRFLAPDAVLLIHCRQLQKTLTIEAPLRAAKLQAQQILSEIENGLRVETEGFEALIAGSDVTIDELIEKAAHNWYVPAHEALERGLIAGIV
jgi:ATP-dependent protease ClpP protease subunit